MSTGQNDLCFGQTAAMFLKALRSEQLRTNRLLRPIVTSDEYFSSIRT